MSVNENDVLKDEKDEVEKDENERINDIFEQVDIDLTKKQNSIVCKDEKIKHKFLKKLLIFGSVFIIGLLIIAFFITKYSVTEFKKNYPEIRATFFDAYESIQQTYQNTPDEELTVKEYYEKQIFSLVPKDDLDKRINGMEKLASAKNIYENRGVSGEKILTDTEKAEYDRLQKEYNDYVNSGGNPDEKYINVKDTIAKANN